MNFIVVTEVYKNTEERKILVPVDMIKYVQDANSEKDTYVAIKDSNEAGKGKYFFIKETVEEVAGMLSGVPKLLFSDETNKVKTRR